MKHIRKFNEQKKLDFNQSDIDKVIKYLDLNFEFFNREYMGELYIFCSIDGKGYNILTQKTYVRRKLFYKIENVFNYPTSLLNKAIKEFLNIKEKELSNLKFDDFETLLKKITKYFDILKIDYEVRHIESTDDDDVDVDVDDDGSSWTYDYVKKYIINIDKNKLKITLISNYDEIPEIYTRFEKSPNNYITSNPNNFKMLIKYLFKHKLIDSKNLIMKINDGI